MNIAATIIALMAALLILPGSSAQTPVSTPASGVLLQAPLDMTGPDDLATIGVTRTTFDTGGTLTVSTGSGPVVSWVESGTITLALEPGAPGTTVLRGGVSPEAVTDEREATLEAGDGVVLAPGATAELRHAGDQPAILLDLLSAPDAVREVGAGADQAVVMSTEKTLPAAPVTVTLTLVVLEPGGHLTLPPEPAISIYAARDPEQIFQVSGNGFSRASEPLEVYVLTIAPA